MGIRCSSCRVLLLSLKILISSPFLYINSKTHLALATSILLKGCFSSPLSLSLYDLLLLRVSPGRAELSCKMDWLHKLRRALLSFSARLKLSKSVGRDGGEYGGVGGLLKLQDDVQLCGYQDVQIMWNILSKAQREEMMIMATTKTQPAPKHNNKKQRQQPSWCFKTFFWTSHAKSPVLV
ncbi:unnamed protein product [Prunus armeniaca]